MRSMLSRNERLWEKLKDMAERGRWSYQTTLYPSEIERIERQWNVSVQRLKSENDKVACLITWSNAFHDGITYKQSWYISKLVDEMPDVDTPAQRLYMIAARA